MLKESKTEDAITLNAEMAQFLLAPILLDTADLAEQVGRATPKDCAVTEKLCALAGFRTAEERTKYFDELQAEKFDNSGLTMPDLLRKDYKQWGRYGVAALCVSLDEALSQRRGGLAQFLLELQTFGKKMELDMLLVMFMHFDSEKVFHRELAMYSDDVGLHDKFSQFMAVEPELQLEEITKTDQGKELSFWVQHNVKASRKQLQPLTDKFFETLN